MKVVFVCGKFRGANAWDVENNIRRAEELGFAVAELGAMPMIPHTNTRFFNGTLTDEFWLAGTTELLKRCDALITVPNYPDSEGARAEIRYALDHDIPVFHSLVRLGLWLIEQEASCS